MRWTCLFIESMPLSGRRGKCKALLVRLTGVHLLPRLASPEEQRSRDSERRLRDEFAVCVLRFCRPVSSGAFTDLRIREPFEVPEQICIPDMRRRVSVRDHRLPYQELLLSPILRACRLHSIVDRREEEAGSQAAREPRVDLQALEFDGLLDDDPPRVATVHPAHSVIGVTSSPSPGLNLSRHLEVRLPGNEE